MELSHQHLKARQREIRDDFPAPLALRTHRALSWLQRAEQEDQDADARFIFLWIAFNAAYANEIHDRTQFSERRILLNFLHRLIDVDSEKLLYKAVWDEFPKSIRLLIDNRYVFQPFWNHQNGLISETLERYLWTHGMDELLEQALAEFRRDWLQSSPPSRDLLPHNLLLQKHGGKGTVKLVDGFGRPGTWQLPYFLRRRRILEKLQKLDQRLHLVLQRKYDGEQPKERIGHLRREQ